MKKEKDTKDFSEKMKAQGWREIDSSQAPHPKRPTSVGDIKSRITIYLDADIVLYFKEMAKESRIGYQTLMNQTLREIIDGRAGSDIKQEILQDKVFLHELKEALAVDV